MLLVEGRYNARFVEKLPFLPMLCTDDKEHLAQRMTFSESDRPAVMSGRKCIIDLDPRNSLDLFGITVRGIRLKGVFPKEMNGIVTHHTGNGFDPLQVSIKQEGIVTIKEIPENESPLPEGTMTEDRLGNEVRTAELLGPTMTHILLGYGIYEGLSFNGKNVGFLVYGLEDPRDQRLLNVLGKNNFDFNLLRLSFKAGFKLRRLHDEFGIFHRYPHSGNYSLTFNNDINIVDLDTAIAMQGASSNARAVMRYLDFAISLREFYSKVPLWQEFCDGVLCLSPLIAAFTVGYFHKNPSLKVYKYALEFLHLREDEVYDRRSGFGLASIPVVDDNKNTLLIGGVDCVIDPLFEFYNAANQSVKFDVFKYLQDLGQICSMYVAGFKAIEGVQD